MKKYFILKTAFSKRLVHFTLAGPDESLMENLVKFFSEYSSHNFNFLNWLRHTLYIRTYLPTYQVNETSKCVFEIVRELLATSCETNFYLLICTFRRFAITPQLSLDNSFSLKLYLLVQTMILID